MQEGQLVRAFMFLVSTTHPVIAFCRLIFAAVWFLLTFNWLLVALLGGEILCRDWYPIYDPDNGASSLSSCFHESMDVMFVTSCCCRTLSV